MANTFVDPSKVARTGIALVRDDLVLAQTVNSDYAAEFGGGKGSTVDVRVPATLTARTRALGATSAITLDDLTESTVPVSLSEMAYSAVAVTDEDLTLNIEDFARQVLTPQTIALTERVENVVAAVLNGLTEDNTIAWDATSPGKAFARVRKALRDMGLPAAGLFAACGTEAYAQILESGQLTDVSQAGDASALRDAEVRKLRGFNVFESNRIAENSIVFYHRDAVTLAVRAPKVPDGAGMGQSLAENGFALRWIKDYDASVLRDRSIVSTLLGCQTMPIKHLKADGTTAMVTGAIRIDISTTAV